MIRKQGSTLFLKAVVILMGIAVLALCTLGMPQIVNEAVEHYSRRVFLPALTGMYASAIPFFYALYLALRLLSYIDKNEAFSERSVRALRNIKYCAAAVSILYAAISPCLYFMAQKDDAPGLLAIGLVIIFAALAIAVFAAVLQMLLKNAIDIKSENDLTI